MSPRKRQAVSRDFVSALILVALGAQTSAPARADLEVERLSPAEQAASSKPEVAHPTVEAKPLSFDEALSQILARSTSVRIQQSNLTATLERNRPVTLAFLPNLNLSARQSTYRLGAGDTNLTSRQYEAVSQLNLFRGGADYANVQAARADESAQRAGVDNALLQAEADAVSALVSEISRRKEIAILGEIVRMENDSLRIAHQRYEGGYLPLQEVEKVEVDLSNARARLADAQIRSVESSALLENLLGHTRVVAEWPWKERFSALPPQGALAALAPGAESAPLVELLSRRPDWRAAQARVEAEDRRVSRNWRLMAPTLDASLAYGYYSGYGNPDAAAYQGSVQVSFPLFDRLVNYSNARAQAAVRSVAETQFEQVRRDARADWEGASRSFETALQSALARDRTLALSRKLYQDNLKRFQAGRISANDLVLDQNRLYESELFGVQGWSAVHVAYARLCRARGLRLQDCR